MLSTNCGMASWPPCSERRQAVLACPTLEVGQCSVTQWLRRTHQICTCANTQLRHSLNKNPQALCAPTSVDTQTAELCCHWFGCCKQSPSEMPRRIWLLHSLSTKCFGSLAFVCGNCCPHCVTQ